MSSPFLGEIVILPFNFNPNGWAFCSGALLPISQNTALFSLLGTTYGGDGKSTFALPNLASRALAHEGQGPGLGVRFLGETFGSEAVELTAAQIPVHTHGMQLYAQNDPAKRSSTPSPGDALSVSSNAAATSFLPVGPADTTFAPNLLQPGNPALPHSNMQPYLAMNFCIALQGIYPQRP